MELESGPNFFTRTATNTFFTKHDNFYGRVRLLSGVILSQLMCHKYSSKTLEKSLSRDSQSAFGTGNGIKVLLLAGTGIGPGPASKKAGPTHIWIQSAHKRDSSKW